MSSITGRKGRGIGAMAAMGIGGVDTGGLAIW